MHANVAEWPHASRMAARCLVLIATSVFGTAASAADDSIDREYWVPLPDTVLADLRGGFDLATGLKISFGIERAIYINGALVTTTAFNIGTLGSAAASLPTLQDGISRGNEGMPAAVIQNGRANFMQSRAAVTNPIAATVIQNTLNNQSIRSLTTVNAAVNSLQILKTVNFGGAMRDALSAAVGPH